MGNRTVDTGAAAFFDVDETLIRDKSMFSFLRFLLSRSGEPDSTYERLAGTLHQAAEQGASREDINRRYYRLYAGRSVAHLAEAGRAWFDTQLAAGDFFVPETAARLKQHRDRGDFVVLLSGSFFACLDPIAAYIGANWAVGTRPVVRDGVLTGKVVTPMIGAAKARTARIIAARRGFDAVDCTAYGDHRSDLDLLDFVGNPVVLGDDAVLTEHASRHGWEQIIPFRPSPATDAVL